MFSSDSIEIEIDDAAKVYVKVGKDLAQAGWEPVTYAVAKPENIIVERFGGEEDRAFFFTVRNTERRSQTVSVTIETKSLGLPIPQLNVFNILEGNKIVPFKIKETRALSFPLKIPAQTTVVVAIKYIGSIAEKKTKAVPLFSEHFDDAKLKSRKWYDMTRIRIAGKAAAGKGCVKSLS